MAKVEFQDVSDIHDLIPPYRWLPLTQNLMRIQIVFINGSFYSKVHLQCVSSLSERDRLEWPLTTMATIVP